MVNCLKPFSFRLHFQGLIFFFHRWYVAKFTKLMDTMLLSARKKIKTLKTGGDREITAIYRSHLLSRNKHFLTCPKIRNNNKHFAIFILCLYGYYTCLAINKHDSLVYFIKSSKLLQNFFVIACSSINSIVQRRAYYSFVNISIFGWQVHHEG